MFRFREEGNGKFGTEIRKIYSDVCWGLNDDVYEYFGDKKKKFICSMLFFIFGGREGGGDGEGWEKKKKNFLLEN